MATLFREVNYKLQALVNDIDMGIVGLPDIQRPFVWKDIKVRDLFDSMYKGYPVGYLLLWANANVDNSKYIGVGETENSEFVNRGRAATIDINFCRDER